MITIIYSSQFLEHQTGYMHPEQPERLTAIINRLKASTVANLIEWVEPSSSRNAIEAIKRVHSMTYIDLVSAYSARGWGCFESTQIFPKSFEVAELAVKAWLDGVDRVWTQGKPVFVLARQTGIPTPYRSRLVWDERRVRRGFHLSTISRRSFERWTDG